MATALSWPGKEKSLTLGRELSATAGPGFTAAGGRLGEGMDPSAKTAGPRSVVPDPDENLLIVGDNLPGLQSLLATHRGRVK
ncbi:site-specific DNA-methyltransferase, partial [Burkholderia multivorans]